MSVLVFRISSVQGIVYSAAELSTVESCKCAMGPQLPLIENLTSLTTMCLVESPSTSWRLATFLW